MKYVAYKRIPTRGHKVFCAAHNVKHLQCDIVRDVRFMTEDNAYQPTPFSRW